MTHKTNSDSKVTIEKCDDVKVTYVARWSIFFDSRGESFEEAITNGIKDLRREEIYATVQKIEQEGGRHESGPLRILFVNVPVEVREFNNEMIDEEIASFDEM